MLPAATFLRNLSSPLPFKHWTQSDCTTCYSSAADCIIVICTNLYCCDVFVCSIVVLFNMLCVYVCSMGSWRQIVFSFYLLKTSQYDTIEMLHHLDETTNIPGPCVVCSNWDHVSTQLQKIYSIILSFLNIFMQISYILYVQ